MVSRHIPLGCKAKGFASHILLYFTSVKEIVVFGRADLKTLALKRPMRLTEGLCSIHPFTNVFWELCSEQRGYEDEQTQFVSWRS